MDRLNEYAPAIVGACVFTYISLMYFRIKRDQAKSRQTRTPAE
jgi:hypothetical protein